MHSRRPQGFILVKITLGNKATDAYLNHRGQEETMVSASHTELLWILNFKAIFSMT